MELQKFELTCGKVNTPDGTTIRDYFNVLDLVEAHTIALEALLKGHQGGLYNVGTGKGHSILEIIDIVKKVTGTDFEIEQGKARKGELPIVYCNPKKFMGEFKWKPKYTLEQAAESLKNWFEKRPDGYRY
jgi:UDP-glucose 4-epimerase